MYRAFLDQQIKAQFPIDDEYEWQPPSEAEMKIREARRERSDKISKLMGDYLLKGYKMLGIVCRECSTILLQNKQGVNYCVACKELDVDADKDDPDDENEWQPPSEAEMKIRQARTERSDKISNLMGDYMLKGYTMLGIVCQECSTILLQDKQGVNYCVACKELDTDTDKDDPVLRRDAARTQVLKGREADVGGTDLPFTLRQDQSTSSSRGSKESHSMATATSSGISSQSAQSSFNLNFNDTVETLCQKINWATEELKTSSSEDYFVYLCQLIKSSAEALQSLKSAG